MRIGLNTRSLIHARAGIGHYTASLLREFAKIDQEDEFFCYFRYPEMLKLFKSYNFHYKNIPAFKNIIWEQIKLPQILKKDNIQIYHGVDHVIPYFCPCKSVVTVHDLSFVRYPESFSPDILRYYKCFVKFSLKKANKIIAISNFTKQEIIDVYRINPQKIVVIPNGVEERFKVINNKEILEEIKKKYNLPEKFILCVSTIEPRKNIKTLLKAFLEVSKNNSEIKLVLTGIKAYKSEEILDEISRLSLKEKVVFTGFIKDEDMPALYNLASLCVYPSLYEGFGLPPLEAMACGIPVVCSNRASLKEVVANAGILVNPLDTKKIAEAMLKVLQNENLQRSLIERGLRWVKRFSWTNTAKEIIKIYRSL